jgi:hypothetical protein
MWPWLMGTNMLWCGATGWGQIGDPVLDPPRCDGVPDLDEFPKETVDETQWEESKIEGVIR